jgi:nucleotide-binding universal stress UspA family protein
MKPIESILIGTGERHYSLDALRLGAALADAAGARLSVAVALDHASVPVHVGVSPDERARRFARAFSRAEFDLDGSEFARFELEGEVPNALARAAREAGADLIVIGRTHQGMVGRLYPGTVADRLLPLAPCGLAVPPEGWARRPHAGFGLVGIAYDGGPHSVRALARAEALAGSLGAALRVITVSPLYGGEKPSELTMTREGMYRAKLQGAPTGHADVAVERVLESGDPTRALARHAVETDLMVIGTHARGRVGRAALGSVSSELVRTAPCPVVVVPHDAEPPEDT